jgi:sigma-E factor negative regulatory protein RseA
MSERMKDALNEQLSACLDGELPAAELDLLLKRVGKEAELRAAIGRYSLIGEAMRAERPAIASRDFASKVMAAVAQEAPMQAPAATPITERVPERISEQRPAAAVQKISPAAVRPGFARFTRPAMGMAIAAGVAAVAVLTMQPQPIGQPELTTDQTPLVAANEPTVAPVTTDTDASYVVPTSTSNPAFIPPAARLTNYVVAHSEYSSQLGRRSVLSGVLADDEEAQVTDGAADDQDAPVQITTSDDGAPVR